MKRLAALVALAAAASADARVPSSKVVTLPATGVRPDITVPYLTNGRSTLGVANGVSPKVVASPILDAGGAPLFQNVYNLPFYGSRLGPGTIGEAATPRVPNDLRGNTNVYRGTR